MITEEIQINQSPFALKITTLKERKRTKILVFRVFRCFLLFFYNFEPNFSTIMSAATMEPIFGFSDTRIFSVASTGSATEKKRRMSVHLYNY